MRIYLDVSCLNRPFDDQQQDRVRLEAEAVRLVLARFDRGEWIQISSEMAEIEVGAIPDVDLRRDVNRLLPPDKASLKLTKAVFVRSTELQQSGLKLADALHVAAAESGKCDAFLTCDDRLLKWAKRHRSMVTVEILNPVEWMRRHGDAGNA